MAVTTYLTLMAAVTPQEGSSPRLSSEALRKLSPGELSDAYSTAQAYFAANPLDARSLSQLSRIAEARGEYETATRLKLIAGDMRPRALSIQAETIAILLKRRDFEGAMVKLDGLIRARPRQQDALFAAVTGIAADPDGRNAAARKLAESPPWRWQFVAHTIAAGNRQVAQRLFSELAALGKPASARELNLLIAQYMKDKDVDAAYAVWLSSLSAEQLNRVKLIYDGGFDEEIAGHRFDWTVDPAGGMTYRLFPRNTSSMDMTLQLDFFNFRGDFKNLSQILRLRPGRYRLTGEARFSDFQSSTGAVFRIHCLNDGGMIPLDETGTLPKAGQWITFEKIFAVPALHCQDQLLRLEIQGRGGPDSVTQGQLALDRLAIDRLPDLAN